jgi:hypothetical protein
MSEPRSAVVVRHAGSGDGFYDLAVRLIHERIERPEPLPLRSVTAMRPSASRPATRMHTIDFTVGDDGRTPR